MAQVFPSALTAARLLLRVLIPLNLLFGALMVAFFVLTLIAGDWVMAAIALEGGNPATLLQGMRIVLAIFIVSIGVTHVLLTRLSAMVESVRIGDAFVVGNAVRLRTMAWALLALELLKVAIGGVAAAALSGTGVDMDSSLSLTPWLAILLLFVLAQVFEDGARMREDLRGTV
jgi:hypothetical protein